tara:strand:+ start:942 stop:1301 length:360 start_codon:yes stop_codon:yes gene_type:complete
MLNGLFRYYLLIIFLSLIQISKAQVDFGKLNEKSPLRLKLYSGGHERNFDEGIFRDSNVTLRIEPRLISENPAYKGRKFQVSEWTATTASKGVSKISVIVSGPVLQISKSQEVKKGDQL